ncbi:NAD(P)H-quinone oxidoreductase [Kineobactrum salinum]|uniref:NAD(P)H-quinone oxidoreductase n=1 Tax=Kineobactrum salinum TaxID=2708301 RepID=A0A6C0TXE1_9GAMM|nr:NAD(P)H-quinone oxidoreductase [Kineobactrum salinum]QIB64446.1 NAD(P)H-quinone oxidoreductase [Kineobactrum salinum]
MRCMEIREPGGPQVLQLTERERPRPAADEVLIAVAAAGVNRPDVMQRKGLYPAPPGASDLPGLEVAGTVMSVGSAVSQWREGDEVCALTNGGGYAEYVTAPAGQCLPLPPGMEMTAAAGLPETCFTVWSNVFDRGRLRAGEQLLVHGGSSGIGTTAIQLARALGATVYATAGSAEKCAACMELGAARAVNYREQDFVEVLQSACSGGFDVILDMVGGDYINRNIKLAAVDGRIVNIAFQGGFEVTVNFVPVLLKRLTLTASTLRPQSAAAKAAIADSLRQHVWPLLEREEVKPVIAAVMPLEEAAAAHELMESSQHIGKIILQVAP